MVALFAEENSLELVRVAQAVELRSLLHRTMPACVVMETGPDSADMVEVIEALKADSFTSIVPLVVVLSGGDPGASDLLEVGAAEMKTFAKSLPGSKYVVDRRHKSPVLETASASEAEALTGQVAVGSSEEDT